MLSPTNLALGRLRAISPRAGFSLIEIILALGIISFALVAILGLFPVAVEAALNSQRETQAALIARSLFDQLAAKPETSNRTIVLADKFDGSSPASVTIDLKVAKSLTVSLDANGAILSEGADPSAAYEAAIKVDPILTPNYGLSNVVITVKTKTTSYLFASLLRQQ